MAKDPRYFASLEDWLESTRPEAKWAAERAGNYWRIVGELDGNLAYRMVTFGSWATLPDAADDLINELLFGPRPTRGW